MGQIIDPEGRVCEQTKWHSRQKHAFLEVLKNKPQINTDESRFINRAPSFIRALKPVFAYFAVSSKYAVVAGYGIDSFWTLWPFFV